MPDPLVLLVEDNPDDVALAQRALSRCGVRAELRIATSGKEAWAFLNSAPQGAQRPRVVFLDLNMPEWNGFDLLGRVRAHEGMTGLPVVVLTTSKEPADIERSYRLGANSFVTKPLDFKRFSEVFAAMSAYWLGINETV
jgi:two-component system response regulator